MIKLEGIEIDGTLYYPVSELYQKQIVSKSTLYRKKRAGEIRLYKNLDGEPMVKAEEFTRFLKKNSAAA